MPPTDGFLWLCLDWAGMGPHGTDDDDRHWTDDRRPPDSGRRTGTGDAATDGGADPGFDEAALYRVVRRAVEDAILGVLGTLLLLAVAFVIVSAGFSLAVGSLSPVGVAVGAAAVAYGFYLAAATLGVIPPVREWF
jgi:hypothetical protein